MKKTGLVAVILAVACGGKEPAAAPTANPPAEPLTAAPAPAPAPSDAPAEPTPEPSATAEATPPAPSEPSLRDLCAKVCVKVAGKCSENVAENCNINCDQYDKTAPACQSVAKEALVCSEAAKDLPCANMAPESCAKQFQRVAQCQKAPESFAVQVEERKGVPSGWQEVTPTEGSFVALFPGDQLQTATNGKESSWFATSGKVRYVIRKLPPLTEKFTPKSQVRLATQWLAPCNLKLKLHGQVEKNDRQSIHYDAGCKDGTERHGMVHITKSALYVVGIEAPAGERGELDAFVYGFRLK